MQALGATQRGLYHEVLHHQTVPFPDVQANDVLIKVAYSDLNPVDLQKLQNGPPIQDGSIHIPGYGGSGTVEQVGSGVPNKALVGKQVCFVADPSRPHGSYASHIVVDHHCVAILPVGTRPIDLRDAASIPVAGLTAYECLAKLGLLAADKKWSDTTTTVGQMQDSSSKQQQQQQHHSTVEKADTQSLLIVGAAGGVGSWLLTLAKAWHPNMTLIATVSSPADSQAWCESLGATHVIRHCEINQQLPSGKDGSVDYIVCLTEPTPTLFAALADAIRPYGKIVLVVAGKSIEALNVGFCFFKCVDICTQTVFSSIRTNFRHICPRDEMAVILQYMAQQTITAPLSPDLVAPGVSEKLADALKPNGVLAVLSRSNNKRGNLVMMVHAGDSIIFLDLKTASIFAIPRKECLAQKILSPSKKSSSTGSSDEWNEQATLVEKPELIHKLTHHPTLGIAKVAEKTVQDYQDGLEMQEAENVKNLWGVSLKKREKNVKGEELLFVDLRTGAVGELSRKQCIDVGAMTLSSKEDGHEMVLEAVTDFAARDDLVTAVRQALKIHLEG